MKRLISSFFTMVMLFSISSPALAAGSSVTDPSGARDLKEQLAAVYGNDYSDVLKYTANYHGQTFKIYERLENRAELAVSRSWSGILSIGSILINILHSTDVSASIPSMITAGSIDKYACRSFLSRYVSINGSNYMYSIAYQTHAYDGYDNMEARNYDPAQIDFSSHILEYAPSQTHFNNYTMQVEDAYAIFQRIGQQP